MLVIAVFAICAAGAAVARGSAQSAASTPRCRLAQLSLAQPKSNGAAGSIRLRFVFTNVSSATCKLFGFPGLQMQNAHHANIHTKVIRGTSVVVPPEPEVDVIMTHGQHGSFYAGYSDVPTGTQSVPDVVVPRGDPAQRLQALHDGASHRALRRQDHGLAGGARQAPALTEPYARAPGP